MIHYSNDFPNNTKGSISEIFNKATIQFGQTVYGGESDFVEGETSDEFGNIEYDGSSDESWSLISVAEGNLFRIALSDRKSGVLATEVSAYCNEFPVVDYNSRTNNTLSGGATNIDVIKNDITSVADFKTWLASNNLQICYEKATPTQLSTPATPLRLLQGTNNLSADGVMQIGYQPDNVIGHTLEVAEDYTDKAIGKNLLPMTRESIKASNSLTWIDDVTFKINNITCTFMMDGGDITGIHVVSTEQNGEFFHLCPEGLDYSRFGGCILSGCTVGDDTKVFIAVRNWGDYTYYAKNTSGDTIINSIPPGSRINIYVYFPSGGTVDTVLRPMIRKAGTDGSYAVPKPSVELLTDLIAYLSTRLRQWKT